MADKLTYLFCSKYRKLKKEFELYKLTSEQIIDNQDIELNYYKEHYG